MVDVLADTTPRSRATHISAMTPLAFVSATVSPLINFEAGGGGQRTHEKSQKYPPVAS